MRFHLCCLLGFLLLSGCGSGQGNALPTVTVSGPSEVVERSLVALSSAASDSDGEVVSYRWVQVSGPTVAADTFSSSVLDSISNSNYFRRTVNPNSIIPTNRPDDVVV